MALGRSLVIDTSFTNGPGAQVDPGTVTAGAQVGDGDISPENLRPIPKVPKDNISKKWNSNQTLHSADVCYDIILRLLASRMHFVKSIHPVGDHTSPDLRRA